MDFRVCRLDQLRTRATAIVIEHNHTSKKNPIWHSWKSCVVLAMPQVFFVCLESWVLWLFFLLIRNKSCRENCERSVSWQCSERNRQDWSFIAKYLPWNNSVRRLERCDGDFSPRYLPLLSSPLSLRLWDEAGLESELALQCWLLSLH